MWFLDFAFVGGFVQREVLCADFMVREWTISFFAPVVPVIGTAVGLKNVWTVQRR